MGNSNFNALETNLRFSGKSSTFLLGYTYSKSIDQGSNIGEQLDPFNLRLSRAISSWDLKHDFVASYRYQLPFGRLMRGPERLDRRLEYFRHNALCLRFPSHVIRQFGPFFDRDARKRREQRFIG